MSTGLSNPSPNPNTWHEALASAASPDGNQLPNLYMREVPPEQREAQRALNRVTPLDVATLAVVVPCVLFHPQLQPLLVVEQAIQPPRGTRPSPNAVWLGQDSFCGMATCLGTVTRLGLLWTAARNLYETHGSLARDALTLYRQMVEIAAMPHLAEDPGLDLPGQDDAVAWIEGMWANLPDLAQAEPVVRAFLKRTLVTEQLDSLVVRRRALGLEPPDDATRQAFRRLEEAIEGSTGRTQLRFRTAAEVRQYDQRPQWLVRGLMVRDSNAFIAGPMKSIKSGLCLDLAISLSWPNDLAGPTQFLGHFACEPVQRALLFSAESAEWVTRQHMLAIVRSKLAGMPLAAGDRRHQPAQDEIVDALRLDYCFDRPRLALRQDQAIIRRKIRDSGAQSVTFDPAYLMLLAGTETEAGSVFEMGDLIRGIQDVCLAEGCMPIFAYHFKKSVNVKAVPKLSDMAWAGAAEIARQWWLLNHCVPYDLETGTARLMLFAGGSAGHGGAYAVDIEEGMVHEDLEQPRLWNVTVRALADAQADAQADDLEEGRGGIRGREDPVAALIGQIVQHMARQPQGTTFSPTALSESLRRSYRDITEALGQAGDNGPFARADGTRARTYVYSLSEETYMAAQERIASRVVDPLAGEA